MATLGQLNRRISVLERRQPKVASSRPVAIVQCTWQELVSGFDPETVRVALEHNPKAALLVPSTPSAEEWNLASQHHHANICSRTQ